MSFLCGCNRFLTSSSVVDLFLFFGEEILFLARTATFLRKSELMQKTLLKESRVIELIEKTASCAQGRLEHDSLRHHNIAELTRST